MLVVVVERHGAEYQLQRPLYVDHAVVPKLVKQLIKCSRHLLLERHERGHCLEDLLLVGVSKDLYSQGLTVTTGTTGIVTLPSKYSQGLTLTVSTTGLVTLPSKYSQGTQGLTVTAGTTELVTLPFKYSQGVTVTSGTTGQLHYPSNTVTGLQLRRALHTLYINI